VPPGGRSKVAFKRVGNAEGAQRFVIKTGPPSDHMEGLRQISKLRQRAGCSKPRLMSQVVPGEVQVGNEETFLLRKSSQALGRVARGGGGVTIPGGVRKGWTWCLGTWFSGDIGGRGMVGPDELGGLFHP